MIDTAHASTALWCMAYEISVPEGYEVAGFNCKVKPGEYILSASGEYREVTYSVHHTGPILKKKAPGIEWVTPTDEDGKNRVSAEFSNVPYKMSSGNGIRSILIGVVKLTGGEFEYIDNHGSHYGYCRMDAAQRKDYE